MNILNRDFIWKEFLLSIFVSFIVGLICSYYSSYIPIVILLLGIISIAVISKKYFLGFFIFWISIQNAVIPFLYSNTNYSPMIWTIVVSLAFLIPAVIVLFWTLGTFGKKGEYPKWLSMGFIYFFITTVFSLNLFAKNNFMDSMYYYRTFLIPLFFVLLGYVFTNKSKENFGFILKTVSIVTILGSIFAIVDYFFISPDFWRNFAGLGKYWIEVKQLDPSNTLYGLPLNFFTLSGGKVLRRAISFYGDPLAAGYSIAIGISAWLMFRLNYNIGKSSKFITIIVMLIMVIGASLTFTRAAYIMIAVFLFYLLLRSKRFRSLFPKVGLVFMIGMIFVFAGGYIIKSLKGGNSSAFVHLSSFNSIPILVLQHPFGTGMLNMPEGTIQTMLYIIGVFPVLTFLLWLSKITPDKRDLLGDMGRGLMLSLIVTSVISLEILTTSCVTGWLILGGLVSIQANPMSQSEEFSDSKLNKRKRIMIILKSKR